MVEEKKCRNFFFLIFLKGFFKFWVVACKYACTDVCTVSTQFMHSVSRHRASIGTIEMNFEAVSPCILVTYLGSLFLKQDLKKH